MVALNVYPRLSISSGGAKRSSPTGGFANGIPAMRWKEYARRISDARCVPDSWLTQDLTSKELDRNVARGLLRHPDEGRPAHLDVRR